MMELNEFEYQMLDALLEAFGSGDQLTRRQVLALFGDDEAFAAEMARVLISEGLVTASGKSGDQQLPLKMIRQAKARTLLENGGFANPNQSLPEPQKPTWDDEHLQKRNTELQYETALTSMLINIDFNDDRFFIHCKKYIKDRLNHHVLKKRKLAELAE